MVCNNEWAQPSEEASGQGSVLISTWWENEEGWYVSYYWSYLLAIMAGHSIVSHCPPSSTARASKVCVGKYRQPGGALFQGTLGCSQRWDLKRRVTPSKKQWAFPYCRRVKTGTRQTDLTQSITAKDFSLLVRNNFSQGHQHTAVNHSPPRAQMLSTWLCQEPCIASTSCRPELYPTQQTFVPLR